MRDLINIVERVDESTRSAKVSQMLAQSISFFSARNQSNQHTRIIEELANTRRLITQLNRYSLNESRNFGYPIVQSLNEQALAMVRLVTQVAKTGNQRMMDSLATRVFPILEAKLQEVVHELHSPLNESEILAQKNPDRAADNQGWVQKFKKTLALLMSLSAAAVPTAATADQSGTAALPTGMFSSSYPPTWDKCIMTIEAGPSKLVTPPMSCQVCKRDPKVDMLAQTMANGTKTRATIKCDPLPDDYFEKHPEHAQYAHPPKKRSAADEQKHSDEIWNRVRDADREHQRKNGYASPSGDGSNGYTPIK